MGAAARLVLALLLLGLSGSAPQLAEQLDIPSDLARHATRSAADARDHDDDRPGGKLTSDPRGACDLYVSFLTACLRQQRSR